eukprot:16427458-Heterocapsa_arctica.AAC.1
MALHRPAGYSVASLEGKRTTRPSRTFGFQESCGRPVRVQVASGPIPLHNMPIAFTIGSMLVIRTWYFCLTHGAKCSGGGRS